MNLGALYALEFFVAYNNSLGTNQGNKLMSFLTSLFNCSNLQHLNLAMNHFKGFLPHSIANLSTKITWLDLQDNYISGSIPRGIGNLVNLQTLFFLSGNMLTSSIPNSIGKLSMLEILMLDKNNISGEIPSSIRNLSRLGTLDLSTNMIEESIPISLGNCTNLLQIHLDYNRLMGEIPCQILGTIPTIFRQLKGIQELDVSRNNLAGQIPRFLGEFRFFQYLKLSYNMFDGEVPNGGVFTNISAFSVVGNTIIYQNKRSRQQVKLASPLQNKYLRLSFGELFQATNGFSPSNLIGEGGYASVYKGILNSDEQIVAVKVLKLHERGANKSFVIECEALKNIRHQNLVKIITACSSIDFTGNDFKDLAFEFMENGSLENWLQPSLLEQHEPKNLNFVQRMNIAIDVACVGQSSLDELQQGWTKIGVEIQMRDCLFIKVKWWLGGY
ncbi:probable LRR receptor-like serine/threonine-protein kinase At3g47570 [Camellia sinensis]|uniref:probable LRR receptor-like serine/threonine-protein kinase At3g47570 n=1 Tax=Camellia sinensis TaxID=4442 RepID=UPI001036665D|nr:probable LRR receptor-like serine/threonine-protein kinase At3g47570 [Camellia sinensis]